jgi:hypothetical protein
MECVYCKKTYSNKYNLQSHQKTTKECIALQKQLGKVVKEINFPCAYCKQVLTTKSRLDYHLRCCKIKKEGGAPRENTQDLIVVQNHENNQPLKVLQNRDNTQDLIAVAPRENAQALTVVQNRENDTDIEELKKALMSKDDEIKTLRMQLETMTHHTTHIETQLIETQNNTTNITIFEVMTPDHVLDVFKKHYKLDTLLGGQKALARFVNDGFLKDHSQPVYMCGDRSRHKFYIVKGGKRVEDPNCENLINLTAPGLPHVQDVYEEAMFDTPEEKVTDIHSTYQNIINMSDDHTDFNNELSRVLDSDSPKDEWRRILNAMKERNKRLFNDVNP